MSTVGWRSGPDTIYFLFYSDFSHFPSAFEIPGTKKVKKTKIFQSQQIKKRMSAKAFCVPQVIVSLQPANSATIDRKYLLKKEAQDSCNHTPSKLRFEGKKRWVVYHIQVGTLQISAVSVSRRLKSVETCMKQLKLFSFYSIAEFEWYLVYLVH